MLPARSTKAPAETEESEGRQARQRSREIAGGNPSQDACTRSPNRPRMLGWEPHPGETLKKQCSI